MEIGAILGTVIGAVGLVFTFYRLYSSQVEKLIDLKLTPHKVEYVGLSRRIDELTLKVDKILDHVLEGGSWTRTRDR